MERKGTHQATLSDFSDSSSISDGDSRKERRPSLLHSTRREKDAGDIQMGDRVRVIGMDKVGKVEAEGLGEFLIRSDEGVRWEVWRPGDLLEKIETG